MKKTLTIILVTALMSLSCSAARKELQINVIPYPNSVEMGSGSFKAAGAAVNCDDQMDHESYAVASRFAAQLTLASGKISSIATTTGLQRTVERDKARGFVFYVDSSLESERYRIVVTKNYTAVSASDHYGFLYATQTLRQLLPNEIFSTKATKADWSIPCLTIDDKPMYHYRGVLLDCSRHFFSIEEIKKCLDVMALYKLNSLHWHLTDDQGWRIEIKAYPELTQIGAYRDGTMIGHDSNTNDGIRYGGYYTQDQIKDVIAYASKLGITIVPEIDLPGHMQSALCAYPYLGCTGGPYSVRTTWGVSSQVLCPGKSTTFEFLDRVLSEVAELFPGQYLHIGGDECAKSEWERCPDCQAFIREHGFESDEHYTKEQYLQSYVTKHVYEFLSAKGKKVIGWDEVLEGGAAPGSIIMAWRGTGYGYEAIAQGHDVIMTPTSNCYLDYAQDQPGKGLPMSQAYELDPSKGHTEEELSHVLGVQGNLWTEYIPTPERLEEMLLPRLLAISEVQWCRPERKDYEGRFLPSLEAKHYDLLHRMGYTYYYNSTTAQSEE